MDIKKLAPWNWFRHEEAGESRDFPAVRSDHALTPMYGPLGRLHDEIDRLFDDVFRSFGFPAFGASRPGMTSFLKPSVDVAATEREYAIDVEVPGVTEDDLTLELAEDRLIIRGQKRQENKQEDRDYYRVERSYGAFQRVLSLPEDADRNGIDARFRNGVLTITVPRKAVSKPRGKVIDIKKAS